MVAVTSAARGSREGGGHGIQQARPVAVTTWLVQRPAENMETRRKVDRRGVSTGPSRVRGCRGTRRTAPRSTTLKCSPRSAREPSAVRMEPVAALGSYLGSNDLTDSRSHDGSTFLIGLMLPL